MKNWSIQRRVLLIALLPAAVLAVVLSTYDAHQHIRRAEARTIEHARAIAAEVGPIAAHVVTAADDDILFKGLAQTLVNDRTAITGITIRDPASRPLLRVPREPSATAPAGADIARVLQPIRRPAHLVSDDDPDTAPLGSVEVRVDLALARQAQIGGLLEGLALTLVALGLTALVAVRIGRSVTDPVHDLVDGMQRIRAGEYGYRPKLQSGGELGQLERGVSELAAGIEGTQRSLHERIEDATHELQETLAELEDRNTELEAARREAEAASEFKSRFLANISHEIRTPMNSILGFTELLQKADLDPVHADYLLTIRNSAQSLLSLLNGILDLSKIESGHMELEYTDTDINGLLYETFNLLAPQAFARGVEFIVAPAPARLASVRVDAIRLKQVLINLASNAVKFTDSGYIRIGADATARPDGGVGLTFSFVDTGRGIPREAQARLFQAFAQGEHMRGDERPRPTGTGLGLHIASEIVFLMDGLIEFSSEPGAGSEFWFTLELQPSGHDCVPPVRQPERAAGLVIDDAPELVTAHIDLLANAGIRAEHLAPPDRSMDHDPDLSGFDAILVHIPATALSDGRNVPAPLPPGTASAPGVFAYAYAQGPEARRRLLDAGYAGVVQKTPEPCALRSALERALDAADDTVVTPVRHLGKTVRGGSTPRRLLVVDDQPLNLKLVESYLEDTAWETVAAAGSDEALYHARLTRFDAILMDIHLPERDGLETSRILRTPGELNATTPILAITADAFAEQTHTAMAAGMNDILVKPVSQAVLLERLEDWCPDRDHCDVPPPLDDRGATGAPCYDTDDAYARAGGRSEVADELFGMLCRHLPSSRADLVAAHERGDIPAVLANAHRLKGAAAYCGVPRLRQDIATLEERAQTGGDVAQAVTALCLTIDTLLQIAAEPRDDAGGGTERAADIHDRGQ